MVFVADASLSHPTQRVLQVQWNDGGGAGGICDYSG